METKKQKDFLENLGYENNQNNNNLLNIIFGNNGVGKTNTLKNIKDKLGGNAILINSDNFRKNIIEDKEFSFLIQMKSMIEKILNDKMGESFNKEIFEDEKYKTLIEKINEWLEKNQNQNNDKIKKINELFTKYNKKYSEDINAVSKFEFNLESKIESIPLNFYSSEYKNETPVNISKNNDLSSGQYKEKVLLNILDDFEKIMEIFEIEDLSRYFILLDEIENSLHPAAMKRIISKIVEFSLNKKINVVISTHTSYVVRETLLNVLISDKTREKFGKIKFYKFIKNIDDNNEYEYIEFDVQQNIPEENHGFLSNSFDLLFFDYVFIVEGKYDFMILNKILEKYSEIDKYGVFVLFGKCKITFIRESLKELKRIFSDKIFDLINFINIDDIDCKVKNDKLKRNNWFTNPIDEFTKKNQIKIKSKAFSEFILEKFENENKIEEQFKNERMKSYIQKSKEKGIKLVMNLNYLVIKKIECSSSKEKIVNETLKAIEEIEDIKNLELVNDFLKKIFA